MDKEELYDDYFSLVRYRDGIPYDIPSVLVVGEVGGS